jgi:hypothetical protein
LFYLPRNCFSTHLVRYVFAKVLIACRKRLEEEFDQEGAKEQQEQALNYKIKLEWQRILEAFGMHSLCTNVETCPFARKDSSSLSSFLCLSAAAFTACMKLVDTSFHSGSELTIENWTLIRDYFELVGQSKYGLLDE